MPCGGASLENLSALLRSSSEMNCADEQEMLDEFYRMIRTQQSIFSSTAHAHSHTLFTETTQCHNRCFVSPAAMCGYSIKSFWKVSLSLVSFCPLVLQQKLLYNVGLLPKKTVQTKCFK